MKTPNGREKQLNLLALGMLALGMLAGYVSAPGFVQSILYTQGIFKQQINQRLIVHLNRSDLQLIIIPSLLGSIQCKCHIPFSLNMINFSITVNIKHHFSTQIGFSITLNFTASQHITLNKGQANQLQQLLGYIVLLKRAV